MPPDPDTHTVWDPGPRSRVRARFGGHRPDDTLDFRLPLSWSSATGAAPPAVTADRLADTIADWRTVDTPAGAFQLVPVEPGRDIPLLARWMNDAHVAAFWELAGPAWVTARHVRAQLAEHPDCAPCLGVLDGIPMSYWEIYRADLDPLARHYPARQHDTGLHLLIGAPSDRGRGLGSVLIRAVSRLVLDHRALCHRVVAEPDLRNTRSIAAFLRAGFRRHAEVDLPDKRAALMIRDRSQHPHTPPRHI